ncbi:Lrp/AsnC family transcriptional regulator [bacterium SCSIO 12696]|nr:Lrp/AsnC family transcriptional regulator [bacterium SCSIO 12696]
MDKFDKAILETLQRDATLSVAEIADRISLSKTACWRRIQKLESEGVVKSRVALLDPEKLNLSLTVFISIRTNQHNQNWLHEFRQVVSGIAEVLEVYRMSGELDYLVRAVVSDMVGFDKLYQELIKADLFDVSSSFVMETIKHTTELPLDNI